MCDYFALYLLLFIVLGIEDDIATGIIIPVLDGVEVVIRYGFLSVVCSPNIILYVDISLAIWDM